MSTKDLLTPTASLIITKRTTLVVALAIGLLGCGSLAHAATLPTTTEMDKYLLIGTGNDDNAKAVDVGNGDLGADIVVLSDEINDNVDFDKDDVFLGIGGWVNVDNLDSTNGSNAGPDYLPGAGLIGEGVSWTGDVALTSPNASFNMSNVELYGQIGVVSDSGSPASSVSNSKYFSDGLGNGFDTAGGGLNMPSNGVTGNADTAMAALRSELDSFESWVTGLAPDGVLSLPDSNGFNNRSYWEIDVDAIDLAGDDDGIAVIDINTGSNDFGLTNSNIVIESEEGTFAIFRILGDANMNINQSTILLGDGVFGNDDATSPSDTVDELGAIFVKANSYNNGQGGTNGGEALNSSDKVFSFNDTVINGVGFYDLIAFAGSDPQFDDGKTELGVQNGQGCTHLISPKLTLSNVRFEHCAFPSLAEPEPEPEPEPSTDPLPEPSSLFLLSLGLAALLSKRRRRV